MERQFEVAIVIAGADGATEDDLKRAVDYLMVKAAQKSPDARFNWCTAHASVQPYTDNPRR